MINTTHTTFSVVEPTLSQKILMRRLASNPTSDEIELNEAKPGAEFLKSQRGPALPPDEFGIDQYCYLQLKPGDDIAELLSGKKPILIVPYVSIKSLPDTKRLSIRSNERVGFYTPVSVQTQPNVPHLMRAEYAYDSGAIVLAFSRHELQPTNEPCRLLREQGTTYKTIAPGAIHAIITPPQHLQLARTILVKIAEEALSTTLERNNLMQRTSVEQREIKESSSDFFGLQAMPLLSWLLHINTLPKTETTEQLC